MIFRLLILVLPVLSAAPLAAHEGPEPCEEAVTVFHDVSRIGRKDRAAANLTRRHAEMAEQGWRFAGSEVYTENGDLEGLFVTYVRSVPCPRSDRQSTD